MIYSHIHGKFNFLFGLGARPPLYIRATIYPPMELTINDDCGGASGLSPFDIPPPSTSSRRHDRDHPELAPAAIFEDNRRIRGVIQSRHEVMQQQLAADAVKSGLCDRIRARCPPELAKRVSRLEHSDAELFKYIRWLEFIQGGIWCTKCSVQCHVDMARFNQEAPPAHAEPAPQPATKTLSQTPPQASTQAPAHAPMPIPSPAPTDDIMYRKLEADINSLQKQATVLTAKAKRLNDQAAVITAQVASLSALLQASARASTQPSAASKPTPTHYSAPQPPSIDLTSISLMTADDLLGVQ